jgi:hypothetical protein
MILQARHYIFPVDQAEPQRLARDFLAHKKRYPQYASTRQKAVWVWFDQASGKISCENGSFIQFDSVGEWDRRFSLSAAVAVLDAADAREHARQQKVPQLDRVREARRKEAEHRWQLSDIDRARIADDFSGKRRIPFAKGIAVSVSPNGAVRQAASDD